MDENEGVNLTYVCEGTTVGYQYDTGQYPVPTVDAIGHRANMTYDAAADQVDRPIIVEKKPEKPEEK